MNILTLNCQKDYNPDLGEFLQETLVSEKYDFLLLQEATEAVKNHIQPHTGYRILSGKHTDGRPSLLCVVYKQSSAQALSTNFELWPRLHTDEANARVNHVSFGVMLCTFNYSGKKLALASVHLPSGANARNRTFSLKILQRFLDSNIKETATIFGGDCNFIFPGECARASDLLLPKYKCVTQALPPTLDSRYTEVTHYPRTKIAYLLRKCGVALKFKTDHLFIDAKTVAITKIKVKKLSDRVSDHSPVEVTIEE